MYAGVRGAEADTPAEKSGERRPRSVLSSDVRRRVHEPYIDRGQEACP